LLHRLAADSRLGLTRGALDDALANPIDFVGAAVPQTRAFVSQVAELAARYPEAARYRAEAML
jgi:adenylosuccinate lyase